jgi:DNA-binding response OmpR family regulator
VDDELEIREILERALTLGGFQVKTAEGGIKGIELCRSFSPHLVLLDVLMPDLGGIEVLQAIRDHDKAVKVVMISGMHDLNTAKDAIALGAIDYVTKPFDLRELDQYIKNLLSDYL